MTTSQWLPLSRSYGVILPSSLTRVLPFVLGFSPRPPVSVCGTGTYALLSSFSRQREFISFVTYFHSPSQPSINTAYFTTVSASLLGHNFPSLWSNYPSVSLHRQTSFGSTGISTSWSSSTPFGLDLVPDLPWEDEPSPGNLRLSTAWFLAMLSLLMPAFSLVYSPPLLSVWLLPVYIAPLPICQTYSKTSVTGFSPVTSSAHHHSTSELLRTL